MPKLSFSIENYSLGLISIEPQNIYGKGGIMYPYLGIPLTFDIKSQSVMLTNDKGEETKYIQHYTLVYLSGELYTYHNGQRLETARFQSDPILHCSDRQWEGTYRIEIPLDVHRIDQIEETRRGNIQFQIDFKTLVAKHHLVPADTKDFALFIERLSSDSLSINFEIQQSHWIDVILPGFGYGKYKIIEVPIPEKVIPPIFQKALSELQESQKYFVKGDYDAVVAQCRNVIQLLPDTCPVDLTGIQKPVFSDKIEKFIEQHLSTLADSKAQALKTIMKSLWGLCSIPHHPSPSGYFNRADAEAVLLITTTLLAYVGKLLIKEESKP